MAEKYVRTQYPDGKVVLSNLRDPITNKTFESVKTTTYCDGSAMTDAKVEGKIYNKLGTEYFVRALDLTKSRTLTVDSVASLRDLSLQNLILLRLGYYKTVITKGYYNPGDGGGIDYLVKVDSSGTDDGFLIIKPTLPFDLQFNPNIKDTVNVKIAGAKGDGVTDDTAAFNKARALGKMVFIPEVDTSFKISEINLNKETLKIVGESGNFETTKASRITSSSPIVFRLSQRLDVSRVHIVATSTGQVLFDGIGSSPRGIIHRSRFENFDIAINSPENSDTMAVTETTFFLCNTGWIGNFAHLAKSIDNTFWHAKTALSLSRGRSIQIHGNSFLAKPGFSSSVDINFCTGMCKDNYYETYAVNGDTRQNEYWIKHLSNSALTTGVFMFENNFAQGLSILKNHSRFETSGGVIGTTIIVKGSNGASLVGDPFVIDFSNYADIQFEGSTGTSFTNKKKYASLLKGYDVSTTALNATKTLPINTLGNIKDPFLMATPGVESITPSASMRGKDCIFKVKGYFDCIGACNFDIKLRDVNGSLLKTFIFNITAAGTYSFGELIIFPSPVVNSSYRVDYHNIGGSSANASTLNIKVTFEEFSL